MSSGKCPKKDGPKVVPAGKVRPAALKAVQAAHPVGGEKSKRRKRRISKETIKKKIAVIVLEAQKVAVSTATAATTTTAGATVQVATTVCTLPNACVPCIERNLNMN